MAEDFDPYFQWLGIPPSEQPPNHYRLLNLPRFESDPEQIEKSVSRLVERLQMLSSGEHVEHAQRILNDVAKARLCLKDPECKAKYDAQLLESSGLNRLKQSASEAKSANRSKNVKSPGPPSTRPPTIVTDEPSRSVGRVEKKSATVDSKDETQRKVKSKKSKPKGNKASSFVLLYAAVLLVVTVGAIVFVVWHFSNSNQQSANTSQQDVDSTAGQQGLGPRLQYGGELSPDEVNRLDEVNGTLVDLSGVVQSVRESRSGKTRYLEFGGQAGERWKVSISVDLLGTDFPMGKLESIVEKRIRVKGIAGREKGSRHPEVRIQSAQDLRVIE